MSSNLETLFDEDRDSPDWIELYNPGPNPVNTLGYAITDDLQAEPWILPEIILQPDTYLVIFASGKNRLGPIRFWRTELDAGDSWRYIIPEASTPANWREPGFDDSSWSVGKSGFGYGDNDDSTVVEGADVLFIRTTLNIENHEDISAVKLHMDYDDSFVFFMNGSELVRNNISSSGPPVYNQLADANHEALLYLGQPMEEYDLSTNYLLEGENTIALQIHNVSTNSSDMSGLAILSLGTDFNAGGMISNLTGLRNERLHSDFKISSDGESIYLLGPDSEVKDSVQVPALTGDLSYGRQIDNPEVWNYYDVPTPDAANTSQGYSSFASEVIFSTVGGVYSENQQVSLSAGNGESIYYTTDGSVPDKNSISYTGPISVNSNAVLRARAISGGSIPGPVNTQNYFINVDHSLPIVAISTHPDNFFDWETGIYVMGPNAQPAFPHFGSNFWQDWERPIHFQLYLPEEGLVLSQNAGAKIFGGWSRGNAQKSLTIHARKSYGEGRLDYPIFEEKEIESYKNIVLRNSGNDWGQSMFRDGLLTGLFHESVDRQAYRPAVVYLNGQYWGLHNIREKINEHFIENNHGIPTSEVNILELNQSVIYGSEEEYADLINFIQSNSLSLPENYEYIKSQIDIESYVHYQVGNIYIHNTDWPGNNIKYWKQTGPEGKWRWIAFDTDFGFGTWDFHGKVSANTISFALQSNGPGWPNPPWSTFLFRRLMANTEFKELFINSLADQMNTNFHPDQVMPRIDRIVSEIQSELPDHFDRWQGNMSNWNSNVNFIRRFARERADYVRSHVINYFNLQSDYELILDVNNESFGTIRLNSLHLEEFPWNGIYYRNNPVTIVAQPKPGFRFSHWEGYESNDDSLRIAFDTNTHLVAVFEPDNGDLGQVIINEINYNSPEDPDPKDWVEIYNRSNRTIDVSNWILKDGEDDQSFRIPSGTSMPAESFLVISRNRDDFRQVFPALNPLGNMEFGFSSDGECIRLYNAQNELSDIVCYENNSPGLLRLMGQVQPWL